MSGAKLLVIPLSTAAKSHPPITVSVSCQNKPAVAIIDQVRAVAKHRLKSKIETITQANLKKIISSLSKILEIS
jgi:mRNA interferase MazF